MINFVAPINDIDMTQPKASQKITVVTVCYNAVKEIEKTIQSVISQTYDNVEYIIVDGGSTDGTLDIIRKYSSRITRWVSEPDKGIFDAMNKSAHMATGEYINFMNAGDLFFDEKVLSDIFAGRSYDEDVLYGSTILHYKGGYKPHRSATIDRMPVCMPFCHQSSFTKVSVLREHPFDTTFLSIADCVFFRQLYNSGGTFRDVKKYIAIYDMYGYVSNTSLKCYFESCLVHRQNPTLGGYLRRLVDINFRPLRYCSLRFMYAERKKPGKYSRTLEAFRQTYDDKA
jgi:glycosyltransferase involved in cell wall biosynthesis